MKASDSLQSDCFVLHHTELRQNRISSSDYNNFLYFLHLKSDLQNMADAPVLKRNNSSISATAASNGGRAMSNSKGSKMMYDKNTFGSMNGMNGLFRKSQESLASMTGSRRVGAPKSEYFSFSYAEFLKTCFLVCLLNTKPVLMSAP
jgi:hypothetical protein